MAETNVWQRDTFGYSPAETTLIAETLPDFKEALKQGKAALVAEQKKSSLIAKIGLRFARAVKEGSIKAESKEALKARISGFTRALVFDAHKDHQDGQELSSKGQSVWLGVRNGVESAITSAVHVDVKANKVPAILTLALEEQGKVIPSPDKNASKDTRDAIKKERADMVTEAASEFSSLKALIEPRRAPVRTTSVVWPTNLAEAIVKVTAGLAHVMKVLESANEKDVIAASDPFDALTAKVDELSETFADAVIAARAEEVAESA
jgi:hypothetical protein